MESLKVNEIGAEIIFSYGFDGTSGQSQYKQKFSTSGSHSDASLFATTLIPLRLKSEPNVILWNNRTPQSVRFCRPIKLEYVKESRQHILKEKQNLDVQIEHLKTLKIPLPGDKTITINYNLFMTLINGKVLNTVTGTQSSQSCPICGATPRNFQQIQDFNTARVFEPRANTLQYGISPLHSWIRLFECILHISYRLDIRKWQVRGSEKKETFNNRKKLIQERFLTQLHLHVDKPKPGFGSTNDGNTARRAFNDTKLFSEVTNVEEELIKNFKVILICLSCQFPIDTEKFEEYCHATARVYMLHYPWYPMPATVHKILVHGRQIIENTSLPVGYFGEEGSEARNKIYKADRLFHARKTSRKNNLEDVFNRAMDTSDPIIASINLQTRISRQHKLILPPEVISMLLEPEQEDEQPEECEADDSEEFVEETCLEEIMSLSQLDVLELDNEEHI